MDRPAATTPIIYEFFKLFAKKQEGLDFINELTGRSYMHNHLYVWSDPKKSDPSIDVYDLMIREVLRHYGHNDLYELVSIYTYVSETESDAKDDKKSSDVFHFIKEGADPTVRIIGEFFALFKTKQEGLDFLNVKTGRNYKHNHMYKWQNPTKGAPQLDVYELMVKTVLLHYGHEQEYALIRHNG